MRSDFSLNTIEKPKCQHVKSVNHNHRHSLLVAVAVVVVVTTREDQNLPYLKALHFKLQMVYILRVQLYLIRSILPLGTRLNSM